MRWKHRQEEWAHKVSWEPQVMAECSTPRRWVFNSLRAGTASMLHIPLMFSSSATAKTASLIWRGQERPVWDIQPSLAYRAQLCCTRTATRQQEAIIANLYGSWRIRRLRPRCICPMLLYRGTCQGFLALGSMLSTNQGEVGRQKRFGWNSLVLVK